MFDKEKCAHMVQTNFPSQSLVQSGVSDPKGKTDLTEEQKKMKKEYMAKALLK
jgi:hypothetical protein